VNFVATNTQSNKVIGGSIVAPIYISPLNTSGRCPRDTALGARFGCAELSPYPIMQPTIANRAPLPRVMVFTRALFNSRNYAGWFNVTQFVLCFLAVIGEFIISHNRIAVYRAKVSFSNFGWGIRNLHFARITSRRNHNNIISHTLATSKWI